MNESKLNHPPPFFVLENGGGRRGQVLAQDVSIPWFLTATGGLYYLSDIAILD